MKKILGQGHGVAGHFCGLEGAYSSYAESKIVILPVPFDQTTTYQKGTDRGPSAIIEASRNLELYDIETHSEVFRKGIYTTEALNEKNPAKMREQLYRQVLNCLNQNKFVVTLGGEHSISYSPIKAHVEKYPDLSILQLDAHADLVESYEGNRWSHACVMARVKELPIKSIVYVGIRSMSREEAAFYQKDHTFFAKDLESDDLWIDQVLDKLGNQVYLTFDVDVFDCSLMPSTGTPEPGGLFWNSTLKLLKKLVQTKKLVGFDVVELCPSPVNIAPDYLCAKLIYKLLSYCYTL